MYSWTWVPDLKLYKLHSVKCSYAIAKITLLVLFAFCILAEFISSSLYFVSVLSVPWNSAQRQTDIHTHKDTLWKLCILQRQSKLFQKHLLTFLDSTDSEEEKKHSKLLRKKKKQEKTKKKKCKVKWISLLEHEHEKHFSKNTHIYVMSANSSTSPILRAGDIQCVGFKRWVGFKDNL